MTNTEIPNDEKTQKYEYLTFLRDQQYFLDFRLRTSFVIGYFVIRALS